MSEHAPYLHSNFRSACTRFACAHNLEALAAELGMSGHVLRNKFNQTQRHKLSAEDLIALYHATSDDTLFDGLLFDCGLTAVKVRAADDPTPAPVRALNATAQIAGVTAQAVNVLSGDRVSQSKRNAVVGGLIAGIEHLALLVTEVEDRFHAVPSLACAADMARAALGA